ncbi:MAG TPA: hypothetical protein PLW10_21840, partial [Myxococcota bacterium]|nr:hypothetical protein [Myxococcota bacterium]
MSPVRSPRAGAPRPLAPHHPFPELVEPGPHHGPWTIADSRDQPWLPTNGAANLVTRHLFVPLERGGLGVSRHELAHVRWSPRRFPRVRHPLIVLQAVEDARINLGLERIGLVVTLDREQLAHVAHLAARDAKAGDVAATVIRAVASLGTEGEAALREEIAALPGFQADLARRLVEDVEARLLSAAGRSDRPVAPFRVAREAARDLARRLEQYDLLRPDHEVEGLGCCHVLLDGEARDGIGFELPWPDPREPEARRRASGSRGS